MEKNEIISAIEPLIKAFDELGISYYIGGSIASSAYGKASYLCSPEDIILNKLVWYKTGGETSERQWNDVIGIIKVQGESLDKDLFK